MYSTRADVGNVLLQKTTQYGSVRGSNRRVINELVPVLELVGLFTGLWQMRVLMAAIVALEVA